MEGITVFDLEQPRFAGMPLHPAHQQAGFNYALHRRHEDWDNPNKRTSAAGMLIASDHAGTHIDALCHQAQNMIMCNDVAVDWRTQTPRGMTQLGIEHVAPIVEKGHVLDVARVHGVDRLPDRYLVTADDLENCVSEQRLDIRPGQVLMVRTGNGRDFRDAERYMAGPAIGTDADHWLAAQKPIAVGTDNVGWDLPGYEDPELGDLPGHIVLLIRGGIHIIESVQLEPLNAAGVDSFDFVCTPLKIEGATASPVRPIALVR